MWKTYCKSLYGCSDYYIYNHSLQITHLCDFEYRRIFHGLTVEEIREREERFEYPPRLQIDCQQNDSSKPLNCSFEISKRSKNNEAPIAKHLLHKKVAGTYAWIYVTTYACTHIQLNISVEHSMYMYPGILFKQMAVCLQHVIPQLGCNWLLYKDIKICNIQLAKFNGRYLRSNYKEVFVTFLYITYQQKGLIISLKHLARSFIVANWASGLIFYDTYQISLD